MRRDQAGRWPIDPAQAGRLATALAWPRPTIKTFEMRARVTALLLLLAAAPAPAANLEWPGPAPCNTSLQACIDAADAGDRIRVGSEGPIDQNLSIVRDLRLETLPGYRPRLAPGRRISVAGNAALDVRVRGFIVERGSVAVQHTGSSALTLSLQDLDITAEPGREGLRIDAGGAGPVGFTIENVAIEIDGAAGGDARAALRIAHAGSGLFDGVIGFVRITASGLGPAAALAIDSGPGSATLDVFGVRIDGSALAGGIAVNAGTGPLAINLVSNAVIGDGAGSDLATRAALRVDGAAAAVTVNALNNTTVGTPRGLALVAGAGGLTGAVQNHLASGHAVRGFDLPSTFPNRRNLAWNNGADLWTPGPGTLTADPRLVDPLQPRLRADSPAIGAAERSLLDAVSAARGLPALDVDGLRRFKGTNAALDIGAFEYGDALVEHLARTDNSASAETWFGDPRLDGQPQQLPLVMARRNGTAALVGAPGLFYAEGVPTAVPPARWALRDDSLAFVPEGAAFDLWLPALGGPGAAFVPVAGEGGGAQLDVAGLNGDPLAVVFVTARVAVAWAPGLFAARPLQVSYDAAAQRWRVDSAGATPLVGDPAFNLYWQPESANAYVHEAAPTNLAGAATVLAHPLLDANACARPIVQQVRAEGVSNPHPLVTAYDAGRARWTVENRTGVAMPPGATFNVLVLPSQAEACAAALFANGFE